VLVVTRFVVTGPEAAEFRAQLTEVVTALSGRPGFVAARLARAADDASLWVLTTEWTSAGTWRRALSAYDVKLLVTPLLARAIDEPSVFEVLVAADADGVRTMESDRAADADSVAPGSGPVR
jgi:quinol monooxygenase YgiN